MSPGETLRSLLGTAYGALAPDHRADLRRSGLTDETIADQALRSVPPQMIPQLLGFNVRGIQSALLFPFVSPAGGYTDLVRIKVFPPLKDQRGRAIRYLQPKGSAPRLYFPAKSLSEVLNGTEPLWLVEGEKKSLAVAQLGLPTVGFCGVEGWHLKDSTDLIADFDAIRLDGRVVELLPDGDYHHSADVKRAIKHFSTALAARNASPRVRLLPEEDGKRVGADDFIVAGATVEDLLRLPVVDVDDPKGQAVIVQGNSMVMESVEWLWPGWLPKGKLSLIVGYPGEAKTLITNDIAARITAGLNWPDTGHAPKGAVVILNLEDGHRDTIGPRLMAAGADLSRIYFLNGIQDNKGQVRNFDLSRDLPVLEDVIRHTGALLVTMDPLSALLGRTNSWRDSEVRTLLTPLSELAERTGAAIFAVMHPNKNSQMKAIQRVSSSIAFGAAPRIVMTSMRNPEDEGRRLFGQIKNNLGDEPPVQSFEIHGAQLPELKDPIAKITWLGPTEGADVRTILEGGGTTPTDKGRVGEAAEFIREFMGDADFMLSDQVEREAKQQGVSHMALHRARRPSGYRSAKVGATWWWVKISLTNRDIEQRKAEMLKSSEGGGQKTPEEHHNISTNIHTGKIPKRPRRRRLKAGSSTAPEAA